MDDEHRREELAEVAEAAARQVELAKANENGPAPTSPARMRALRRAADRAKLAFHRGRSDV